MINVCVSCSEEYSKYAGVLIASILSNAADDDCLNFFILNMNLSELRKSEILKLKNIKDCEINFISVNTNLFNEYKKINTHSYIPISSFFRLKLASLLPDLDRVIYLDCDIVVNRSIAELYNTDLNDNIAAAVLDINKRKLKKFPTYVNSGVLLLDLNKIRKLNIESEFLNWTKSNFDKIKTGDQDIINEVLKNKIEILDERWNVQSSNFTNRSSYTSNPYVIHYVSKRKPWHFGSFSYHKNLYFKYLQLTPWALSKKEKFHWYFVNNIVSFFKYLAYRPLFFLRPNFYKALFYTYIKPY